MSSYLTNWEIVKKFGITSGVASRIGNHCQSRLRDDGRIEYRLFDVQKKIDERNKSLTEIPADCLTMTAITAEFHYSRETIRRFQKKGIFPKPHGVAYIGTGRLKTYFFLRKEIGNFFKEYEEKLGIDHIPDDCVGRDGICKMYKIAWTTLQSISKQKDFPGPAGKYKTKSNLSCDFFKTELLDDFFAKRGKLRVNAISVKNTEPAKKQIFLSSRGKMTKLRSGAIVPRRVVQAPDNWGLL